MADERDLVATLLAALSPVPVWWGYAPLDSMSEPPTFPLVVVQRQTFSTAGWEDMCADAAYKGDTILAIDSWTKGYEEGRALATAIRTATGALGGWRLQGESDFFEPNVRAWRIQGQWLAAGVPPL
jgi:hypothetical protein